MLFHPQYSSSGPNTGWTGRLETEQDVGPGQHWAECVPHLKAMTCIVFHLRNSQMKVWR